MYSLDRVGEPGPAGDRRAAAGRGPAGPGRSARDRRRRCGTLDLAGLSLPEKVATVIAAMLNTTPDALPVDSEGDIGIRSGSAMVFVRVRDNPPLVDVFSPVLTEVEANEQLYVRLSELTHRMPIGRLYCAGETVWASVPVFGRDFQADPPDARGPGDDRAGRRARRPAARRVRRQAVLRRDATGRRPSRPTGRSHRMYLGPGMYL